MGGGDGVHEGEPEPGAATVAGGGELAGALGRVGEKLRGHAVSLVVHGKDDARGAAAGGKRDSAGAVAHRVVDQVAECTVEQRLVGLDEKLTGGVRVRGSAARELGARPPCGCLEEAVDGEV